MLFELLVWYDLYNCKTLILKQIKFWDWVYSHVLLIVSHLISEDNLLGKLNWSVSFICIGVWEQLGWEKGGVGGVLSLLGFLAFCIQNKSLLISMQHLDIFSCPWCSSQQTKHWSACLKQYFFHLIFLKRYFESNLY